MRPLARLITLGLGAALLSSQQTVSCPIAAVSSISQSQGQTFNFICLDISGVDAPLDYSTSPPTLHIHIPLFVDNEEPLGALDGTNPAFLLQFAPNPPESLRLNISGKTPVYGFDYNVTQATIVFATAPPGPGSIFRASYRH